MRQRIHEQEKPEATPSQMSTPPPTFVKPAADLLLPASGQHEKDISGDVHPEDTIGQFSYGPATQTTVVTTTTTTTTKFPPLMLRAPRNVNELDPKFYPLAASPTPSSIRKFVFEADGKFTTFAEAEDTVETAHKLHSQNRALADSQGSIKSISGHPGGPEESGATSNRSLRLPSNRTASIPVKARAGVKRSASPVSLSEAATIAAQDGPRKRRMVEQMSARNTSNQDEPRTRMRRSQLRTLQTSTPITPHLDEDTLHSGSLSRWAAQSPQQPRLAHDAFDSPSASLGIAIDDELQILSPQSEDGDIDDSPELQRQFNMPSPGMSSKRRTSGGNTRTDKQDAGSSSPSHQREGMVNASQRSHPQAWPRPQVVDTAAAQDASLPSPSLSPVRAGSQIHARSLQAQRRQENAQRDQRPRFDIREGRATDGRVGSLAGLQPESTNEFPSPQESHSSETTTNPSVRDRSLMCIPQIIDDFESMPEEIKKYVMYQCLRRCSKPVLHFVVDTINPALKCDFLKRLPLELCEVVIGHLDVKSLCAAAQVSRKWRQQVDLSEKIWRRLFYEDGYCLQEGELARAIREGWGWQTISNPGDGEKDLSLLVSEVQDVTTPASSTAPDNSVTPQRSRRKGKQKTRVNSKPTRRRKHPRLTATPEMDDDALLVMQSATDGPYAAASAAAAAIALPRSDLHLWKSIYMRHHIIRRTWLQEDVSPRHIAFRAHQRHVVTCLQFDSDKILTGSDDANINVYDTQTGALRAKLEGHEGGVWALQYEGNVLVSGSTDRSVRVWDIERGICTHTFQGHTSTVRCLQILLPTPVGMGSDGRPVCMPKQPLIITGSRDSHLRVWKLPKSGDPHLHQAGPAQDESSECPYYVRTLTGHHHSVRAIAAHADTLVSGSYDCTVRVWRISTGELVHRLTGHTQKVYSVVLDNKRNRCISGSMDNVVKVWSLDTGMALFNLEGHSSLVGLLDLQQDRLVSAAADSTLRIWDPENGQCKSTLSAHTGAITCFQHDGQKVISGSDRTLKMWNVSTGEFAKDLLTDLSGVWQVKFNERRCVAAVQRNNLTFIEVLDFGACRDGVSESKRGRRILVDIDGHENPDASQDVELIDVT